LGIPLIKYFTLLKTYLLPFKKQVVILATTMVLSVAVQIINPQIIRYYIDEVSTSSEISTLQNAALLFIVFAIIQQVLSITSVFFSQRISWGSTNLLRSEILSHTMGLDMTFHNKYKPGDLIERVDGDVNALSNFFSRLVLMLVSNILLIVGILGAIFIEDLTLGLVFTVFTATGLFVTYYVRKFIVPYWKKTREANMQLFGFLEEHLQGIEDIRSLGMVENVKKKHYQKESEKYKIAMKAMIYSGLMNLTFNGMVSFGTTLVYVVGVPIYLRGGISLGSLFILNYYVALLINPIFVILSQIQTLQQADASIERIEELLTMESKIQDNGLLLVPEQGIGLSFDNVDFAYHEDKNVLSSLNFRLDPGKKLGIIGRTGSGKTTIARLIYRFYDPQRGNISIAGNDVRDYQLGDLRSNIGAVTQDVQIFQATLKQNLTFFDDRYSDEEILDIIKRVGLWDWYTQQSDGLNTRITEKQLSAGQAQLLSVGRLFLKQPKIIILDEASSRLDPVTEKALDNAVNQLLAGRTSLIIAHRLSTLDKVDYILNIKFGKIIEFGEREELLNNKSSEYSKLIATGKEMLLA